jgi:glycosyltransferase involved in cell wall biosynthesis
MTNVLFLNSHPIQYFAPLYQEIEKHSSFSVTALYCSKHGLAGETDREFNTEVKWDIPILSGYKHVFLKNHAPNSTIYRPWGLLNLGIISFLFKAPKSILVVHGWGYFTHLLALLAGRLAGHIVCLRGENPASHEQVHNGLKWKLKHLLVRGFLSPLAHYIFYIGKENKAFYLQYGVKESKLIFAPYAVDNQRFQKEFSALRPKREELKTALGLPAGKTIVLFSGKYILKKRPLDLLKAFQQCQHRDKACLVFMGDGPLRPEMEAFIAENKLDGIILTGFVNQSKVAEYYAVADIFVMCSQQGETWGLSVNEAMNFSLPLLLSDMTGSATDLVSPGESGWVFKTGDVAALAGRLDAMLALPKARLAAMGAFSQKKVEGYSYRQIIQALEEVSAKAFA